MPEKVDERYEVRDMDAERALRTIATLVEEQTPEGMAFALFLVPFGEHLPAPFGKGAVFYISTGDRQGMASAIRGWLERQDGPRA